MSPPLWERASWRVQGRGDAVRGVVTPRHLRSLISPLRGSPISIYQTMRPNESRARCFNTDVTFALSLFQVSDFAAASWRILSTHTHSLSLLSPYLLSASNLILSDIRTTSRKSWTNKSEINLPSLQFQKIHFKWKSLHINSVRLSKFKHSISVVKYFWPNSIIYHYSDENKIC